MRQKLLFALIYMTAFACASQRQSMREDQRIDVSEFRHMVEATQLASNTTGVKEKYFFTRNGHAQCRMQLECMDDADPYNCTEVTLCLALK